MTKGFDSDAGLYIQEDGKEINCAPKLGKSS
jgi:hypothetical protein